MQNWFRPELKTTICAQQKIAKAHTKKTPTKNNHKNRHFCCSQNVYAIFNGMRHGNRDRI